MWKKLEDEFLSLLWSECECGRNWRMSFFPYYGVCVWQRLVDEFLSLLWSVCDRNWRMNFCHYYGV